MAGLKNKTETPCFGTERRREKAKGIHCHTQSKPLKIIKPSTPTQSDKYVSRTSLLQYKAAFSQPKFKKTTVTDKCFSESPNPQRKNFQ